MSEWISVEKKLPEYDYDSVLVAVCPTLQMNQVHFAYRLKGRWYVLDEAGNHADFITHWQELPNPPQQEI